MKDRKQPAAQIGALGPPILVNKCAQDTGLNEIFGPRGIAGQCSGVAV
jgi:hypothetical protein